MSLRVQDVTMVGSLMFTILTLVVRFNRMTTLKVMVVSTSPLLMKFGVHTCGETLPHKRGNDRRLTQHMVSTEQYKYNIITVLFLALPVRHS